MVKQRRNNGRRRCVAQGEELARRKANRLPDINGDRREFTAGENERVGMLFQSPVGLRDISFGQRSEGLMPQIDRKPSPTYLPSADAGHLLLWLF